VEVVRHQAVRHHTNSRKGLLISENLTEDLLIASLENPSLVHDP